MGGRIERTGSSGDIGWQNVRLMLLDVQMPGISGLEVLRQSRRLNCDPDDVGVGPLSRVFVHGFGPTTRDVRVGLVRNP